MTIYQKQLDLFTRALRLLRLHLALCTTLSFLSLLLLGRREIKPSRMLEFNHICEDALQEALPPLSPPPPPLYHPPPSWPPLSWATGD